ncbi:ATP-binding protein [Streptomyces sp. AC495_CC817]|uniref:ATP-binding protein n=1 Tax=Streptomyces sp. AC495_CC817 TaxID=2823900 RepID=UPI0027E12C9F|nr:ATP-binding protein [Streptomyces sp. AC495_CC817]
MEGAGRRDVGGDRRAALAGDRGRGGAAGGEPGVASGTSCPTPSGGRDTCVFCLLPALGRQGDTAGHRGLRFGPGHPSRWSAVRLSALLRSAADARHSTGAASRLLDHWLSTLSGRHGRELLNEVTFRLSRSRRSVPGSRAALHAVLGGWGVSQDILESAELVLSELVTNALRVPVSSDRQVGVRIARSLEDGLLRLEVSDAGAGNPKSGIPVTRRPAGAGCCSWRRWRTAGASRSARVGLGRRCGPS